MKIADNHTTYFYKLEQVCLELLLHNYLTDLKHLLLWMEITGSY